MANQPNPHTEPLAGSIHTESRMHMARIVATYPVVQTI
jgi:hypothetical protein